MSVDYYVKLEQGRAKNISEQALAAIENALKLDDIERRHLRSLIRPDSVYTPRPPATAPRVRAALLTMIHAIDPVPAVIHGPHLEVLGINYAGSVLLDDFDAMPLADRNMAKWMFLNPRAKRVYLNWDQIAPQMVAILRNAAIPGVRNDTLSSIIGDLMVGSEEFARMWSDYQLFEHTYGVKRFFHEAVGEMKINYETLPLPADRGQTVIVYSADAGSPSEEKLKLLVSWTSQSALTDS